MIGKLTGKVVGFAVRSKDCKTCHVAKRKKQEPPDHDYRHNWDGSAKAMEPDMVVETVQKVEERGAKMKHLSEMKTQQPLPVLEQMLTRTLLKESDSSHMKKFVNNMLHNLRNTNKSLSLKIISYLKKLFNYMLAESTLSKPDMITEGLRAIPNHAFCCHDYCG